MCEVVSSSEIVGLRSYTHSQPAGSPSRRDLRYTPCSLLPLAPCVIMLLGTEAHQLRAEPYSLPWTPLLREPLPRAPPTLTTGAAVSPWSTDAFRSLHVPFPPPGAPFSTPWRSQFSDLSLNVLLRRGASSPALPHSVLTHRAFMALTCLGAVFLVPVMSQCPVASSRMGVSHTRRPAHTQPSRGPGTQRVSCVCRMDEWMAGLLLSLLVSR